MPERPRKTRSRSRPDGRDGRAAPLRVYNFLIMGGGPAGLGAALVLGRCQGRVLVIDEGRPRNDTSGAMHGYLTRDGIDPHEFLRLGRAEAAR